MKIEQRFNATDRCNAKFNEKRKLFINGIYSEKPKNYGLI